MDWISSQKYAEFSIDCAVFVDDLPILLYLTIHIYVINMSFVF